MLRNGSKSSKATKWQIIGMKDGFIRYETPGSAINLYQIGLLISKNYFRNTLKFVNYKWHLTSFRILKVKYSYGA